MITKELIVLSKQPTAEGFRAWVAVEHWIGFECIFGVGIARWWLRLLYGDIGDL